MATLPKGHEIDKCWIEESKHFEPYGRSPGQSALQDSRLMMAIDMARDADDTALMISRGPGGRIHDVVRLTNLEPARQGGKTEAMKALTFSQKMDHDITRAMDIGTVSNVQARPTTLSVDIINKAFRLLDENLVLEQPRHMTGNEVRMRMAEHYERYTRDLFIYGAAAMFLPGGTKKMPRPHEQDEFHWMANLPGMLKRGAFTAWLLNDTCKVWDESDQMGHCLFRSYRARMEKGEYIAYHVDAPHLFKNGFTVTMERWQDGWAVDQVRGKANSTSQDGALQLFVDHLCEEVNKAYKRDRAP